ncbi:MAG: hypothetical protein KJZ83_11235, partial [Burkholderiaceae bacterium]|nr:hypothetical protein [Burkholderiaceae bacterium]
MAKTSRQVARVRTLAGLRTTWLATVLAPLVVFALAAAALWYASTLEMIAADSALGALALTGVVVLAASGVFAFALGRRFSAEVIEPVARLQWTLARVTAGDMLARAELDGDDDLSRVAGALDDLLEYRIRGLETISREGEELNDSVIEIMQAVGTIATSKDLTIRV